MVVSKDIAQGEIEKWLEYKKVSDIERQSNKENIDSIIDSISQGHIVLNEDYTLVQTLKFPIEDKEGKTAFSILEYKPRINVSLCHLHLQGVKSTDADGRLLAYVCALTSKPKELIKKLDTSDYKISQSIAIFFL